MEWRARWRFHWGVPLGHDGGSTGGDLRNRGNDGDLEDTDRVKFVTRERLMKWTECLLRHLYVQVAGRAQHHEAGCGGTDGHQLLTFLGEF